MSGCLCSGGGVCDEGLVSKIFGGVWFVLVRGWFLGYLGGFFPLDLGRKFGISFW